MPISTWEEMPTKQALLAMVNIFDELGMIDKSSRVQYTQGKNALKLLIFQYGDVLTIKKWHALAYTILQ